ncbi:MFS transporter [Mangrovimonas spongiae]|uniref:MFS transporter n=1 Tax=Mangrovimonas spongiae TaxID=2494697 RepID=A0A428K386_9FLAO|nr:MFS transporter [Mangrovimonas spongiae]RSK40744.1 MFS transporter [Mangrovimonas spongiae]
MKRLFNNYINTFGGLSKEIWWLALIMLVNRAGTMVVPFLSLYLTTNLNFTVSDVGWIMSAFGLGSVVGSWLGGKLTDVIGYYKVMMLSLFTTGLAFIGLQYLQTFNIICLGIFITMILADTFRPAAFVAMSAYSKTENKTRSVTLIRLAINLGFSAGPAIGGIIITNVGYNGLFWLDGITCIAAAFLLIRVLNPKKAKVLDEYKNSNPKSAYSDMPFMIFILAMVLFGIVFLQYFSTMPIYYKNIHLLNEVEIGLLLGLSGLVIFLLEMPIIKWLETKSYSKITLMIQGAILLAISFLVVIVFSWTGVLVIGILLMTFAEMVMFPFSNAFALDRSKRGNQGEYMALYSIAFSISHIFGHNAGMQMTDTLGYNNTWLVMVFLSVVCIILLQWLKHAIKPKINTQLPKKIL